MTNQYIRHGDACEIFGTEIIGVEIAVSYSWEYYPSYTQEHITFPEDITANIKSVHLVIGNRRVDISKNLSTKDLQVIEASLEFPDIPFGNDDSDEYNPENNF